MPTNVVLDSITACKTEWQELVARFEAAAAQDRTGQIRPYVEIMKDAIADLVRVADHMRSVSGDFNIALSHAREAQNALLERMEAGLPERRGVAGRPDVDL